MECSGILTSKANLLQDKLHSKYLTQQKKGVLWIVKATPYLDATSVLLKVCHNLLLDFPQERILYITKTVLYQRSLKRKAQALGLALLMEDERFVLRCQSDKLPLENVTTIIKDKFAPQLAQQTKELNPSFYTRVIQIKEYHSIATCAGVAILCQCKEEFDVIFKD